MWVRSKHMYIGGFSWWLGLSPWKRIIQIVPQCHRSASEFYVVKNTRLQKRTTLDRQVRYGHLDYIGYTNKCLETSYYKRRENLRGLCLWGSLETMRPPAATITCDHVFTNWFCSDTTAIVISAKIGEWTPGCSTGDWSQRRNNIKVAALIPNSQQTSITNVANSNTYRNVI